MGLESQMVLSLTLYKLACLATGLSILYMGYRLFMAGIYNQSGDMEATFKNIRMVVKSAAPGIFFALFGTIVISIAISRGLELNLSQNGSTLSKVESNDISLPDNPPVLGNKK
ncbi:MAG: hypothetical protein RL619_397 [Bacteroidota bacterium]|jgi:hypothetical protein